MASGKELKAIITIAGTIDPSLGRAIAGATKSMGGLGTAMKVAGTVVGIGAAAVGAATTAMVAFGKSSVEAGMNFDSSMSQVAATMGTTVDQIGELRDFAMEMGRTTAFSATECADALNYMALAGYDAETSMAMLPNVLNLAAAGNMDLARASDMVTDTQTAFGLSIERTSLMVDEMAKAASTGNTSVEQLGDAFLEVGGLVQELNGGFVDLGDGADAFVDGTQEMEIALTAMANAGIKGSEAGTHMRNMLLKLTSPTKEGIEQFEALGVSVFDAEGKMRSLGDIFGDLSTSMGELTQEQKIQAISDLFNARDIASAEALLNAVSQDWNKIGSSILEAKMPLDEVQEAIQKSGVDLSKSLTDADINVKDLAADIRTDLVTENMNVAQTAADIANGFDISFSEALTMVNSVNDALQQTKGAAQQMADTQLDNLAGDITIFKSALEGAQIVLSDQLSPQLREFVQFGTNGISRLADAFQKGGLSGAMSELGNVISEGLAKLSQSAPQLVKAGAEFLKAIIQGVLQNMPQMLQTGVQIMQMLIQGAVQAAPELMQSLAQAITESITTLFGEQAGEMAGGLFDALGSAFDQFLPPLQEMFSALMEMIPPILEELQPIGELVITVVQLVIDAIGQVLQALAPLVQYLSGEFTTIIQQMVPLVSGVVTAITPILQQIITGILPPLLSLLQALMPILQLIFSILGPILEIIIQLVSMAMPIISTWIQTIITLLTGLIQFLSGVLVSAVQSVVETVLTVITPIMEYLQNLIDFVVNVFTGQWGAAWENVKNMFAKAFQALAGIAKSAFNAVIKVINAAIDGLNSISVDIPVGVPLVGGTHFSLSIAKIPELAHGGFTQGVSIAGEAGQEAVISFDPSVRQQNLSYWAQAGKLLGVNAKAVDTVAANAKSGGSKNGNFITFSPNITIQGNADYDSVLQALRDSEEEFMDMFNEFLKRRESVSYG
jgi:TP901 family phage tail tape measure protein